MSKGRREAPVSASARLCEWRGLNWGGVRLREWRGLNWRKKPASRQMREKTVLARIFDRSRRLRERLLMSKGRREAPVSASARLCEWRGLNWGPATERIPDDGRIAAAIVRCLNRSDIIFMPYILRFSAYLNEITSLGVVSIYACSLCIKLTISVLSILPNLSMTASKIFLSSTVRNGNTTSPFKEK